jgi:hypothetical protein
MALGKQFDNTYWNHPANTYEYSPESGTTFYGREKGSPKPSGRLGPHTDHEVETHSKYTWPHQEGAGTYYQGMLFPAATATGLHDDPLVPYSTRRDAIKKALDLENVETYRANVGRVHKPQMGNEEAEGYMELLANTLHHTDYPLHELNKTSAHAAVVPEPGVSWVSTGNNIKMHIENYTTYKKSTPTLSHDTLVHEIGHTRDPHKGGMYDVRKFQDGRADPIKEGIADAFTDRFANRVFDDTLRHSSKRTKAISNSGYGTQHDEWQNDTQRALYAATRFHSALGDQNFKDIPAREDVSAHTVTDEEYFTHEAHNKKMTKEFGNLVNHLTLGHMYEHLPHIREHLDAHGYTDTAKNAHNEYLLRTKGKKGTQFEQVSLPGMETY